MDTILHEIAATFTRGRIEAFLSALIILIVGFYLARRIAQFAGNLTRLDLQQRLLFKKLVYYTGITLTLASALNQLGFDLKVLLGAAGVLTVAVGFAAQTSASNLISGLFLMAERPFVVGQTIQIGDISGEVMAIDLLSCRIRTFDNRMVRIPNESMVKSSIFNLSYFPIRRIDMNFMVSYRSSIEVVERALLSASNRCPLILDEPKPLFIFQAYGESALNVQYQTWTLSKNLTEAQNSFFAAAKIELQKAQIEIEVQRQIVSMPAATITF